MSGEKRRARERKREKEKERGREENEGVTKRMRGGESKREREESVKSSDQFSKYAVPLRCFLIIVIAIALPAALSVCAALATATIITALGYELLISREQAHGPTRACNDEENDDDDDNDKKDVRDGWYTFAFPANESTKYARPRALALPRLVIIKRYKREADCAQLIASLRRNGGACETKREKLYDRELKNESSSQ